MYTNIPSTYNNIFNTPRSMTNILLLIISCKKKIKLTMLLYITLSRDLKMVVFECATTSRKCRQTQ